MKMTTKGFKVTDAERKTRVGIAVKTIDELKTKTIQKFKLKLSPSEISFQLPDGTFVDNDKYFQTLSAQTLLIWVKEGESAETDAEILYKTLREVNDEYLSAGEKVQEFFTEKMKNKVYKLAELLKGIDGDQAKLSLKSEDPEWFKGLDTSAKTKEEYLFRRAQDRIRTYFYKTREELRKKPDLPQEKLQILLIDLQNRLKISKYNGHLFDRNRASENDPNLRSFCSKDGTFLCQGRWDKEECLYTSVHQINPYKSKEERIIFQTWNLDHTKERTRSVIPAICQALKSEKIPMKENEPFLDTELFIDVKAIFNDLFTVNNLKIVHIVCHDKSVHSTKKAGPYVIL